MFKAAGGMGRFVLEVDIDTIESRHVELDQVGVCGTVEIRLDQGNGAVDPVSHVWLRGVCGGGDSIAPAALRGLIGSRQSSAT